MKNVLVVGGAGFIGSHLCDALLARGDKVVCMDNLMRGKEENISHNFSDKNFTFIKGDAATDMVEGVLEKYNIDFVYHLAANSDIQASAKDPKVEFESTLSTTWRLLYAMKKFGVKNMFFASTSAVYGEQCDKRLCEEDILIPISYYGAAKAASEAFIHAFAHMNDMNVCVFRFPNVIGPRLTHGVIFDFINKLKKDPTRLEVLGDGTQCKPYMYVSDLVEAIVKFADTVRGVEIFNLGVESATTVKTIAETVVREMDMSGAKIVYGTEKIGWKGDVPHFSYNLDKIKAKGWLAHMTSDEAVVATVRDVLCKR